MATGTVVGSTITRLSPAPRRRSAATMVLTSATFASPSSPCRSSGVIFSLLRKIVGMPFLGIRAKQSTTGTCGTSRPRRLNSQLIDSGTVSTSASAFSSAITWRSSASLSAADLPARLCPRNSIGALGGAGRSCQISSTRLAEGTSVALPLSFFSRSSISAGVCSQGSKPSLPPAGRNSTTRGDIPPCVISTTLISPVSVSAGACSV